MNVEEMLKYLTHARDHSDEVGKNAINLTERIFPELVEWVDDWHASCDREGGERNKSEIVFAFTKCISFLAFQVAADCAKGGRIMTLLNNMTLDFEDELSRLYEGVQIAKKRKERK